MINKINSTTHILGNLVVLAGLALLAYLGFYNRYWADDWCYSADARTLGTLPATLQYFSMELTEYSTNRYSLTFFSALTENTLGMFGNQMIATVVIGLWLFGLVWVGGNLSRGKYPRPAILLAAGLLLFYNLYLSPQRFQILYWRSGVLPYSAAIILGVLMFGFIARQMNRAEPLTWANAIVALIAFLAAGLGEISCVYLFSAASLLLLATWYAKRKGASWAERSFQMTFVAWLFLLLGMIALIASPSNSRVSLMKVRQNAPLLVPAMAFHNALGFIVDAGRSLPTPHAIFTLSMFALALSSFSSKTNLSLQRAIKIILASALITFILILAIQTPSAYFYSAPPDPRGQSLSRFTLLVGLAIIAWTAGIWTAETFSGKWLKVASALVLLAGFAYTARCISVIYAELPGFIYRAQVWDERDEIIKKAKAQGLTLVEVPMIDVAQIHTRDMFRSKGKAWTQFTENCAARYYGVDGLKVIGP